MCTRARRGGDGDDHVAEEVEAEDEPAEGAREYGNRSWTAYIKKVAA
jgi:hypothetical protein